MTGTILVTWLYPSQGLYGQKDVKIGVELDVDTVADVIHAVGKRVESDRVRRWYLARWRLDGHLCTPNTVIDRNHMLLAFLPKIMGRCGRCAACRARKRARR